MPSWPISATTPPGRWPRSRGCERFDVLRPRTDAGAPDDAKVMLFELYTDQAAFDAHRANPRMPGNAEKSAPMLAGRKLTICETP